MEQAMEELLFNLSCVEETERVCFEDWIYYINSRDLTEEGDGAIWKVRKDGTENQRVQKSDTKVFSLIGVDAHWIYFVGKTADYGRIRGVWDILHTLSPVWGAENRKMTVRGGLERPMSDKDMEYWDDRILRLEEEA